MSRIRDAQIYRRCHSEHDLGSTNPLAAEHEFLVASVPHPELSTTVMDILFVHNSFPAQFKNLVASLSDQTNVRLAAIGSRGASEMDGVRLSAMT